MPLEGSQYDPSDYQEEYQWSEPSDPEENIYVNVINITEWVEEPPGPSALATKVKLEEKPQVIFNHRARRKKELQQPLRDPLLQQVFETYIDVDGIKAHALIDPGCTTDLISGDFVRVCQLNSVKLEKLMALQLAVSGSRSKVNYGTWATLNFQEFKDKRYFDIANIDQFDMILGTPFLWSNGISLTFEGEGTLLCKRCPLGIKVGIPRMPKVEPRKRWFR